MISTDKSIKIFIQQKPNSILTLRKYLFYHRFVFPDFGDISNECRFTGQSRITSTNLYSSYASLSCRS